jgi:hypothetical protein
MRIGFDTSALVRPHPPGIVRVVTAAMAALQLTPGITAVPLAPSARDNLRIWRQLRLPLMVRERGSAGAIADVLRGFVESPQTLQAMSTRSGVSDRFSLQSLAATLKDL